MDIDGSGLIREVDIGGSGLIREVAFCGSGLIREVAFWWEWPYKRGTTVMEELKQNSILTSVIIIGWISE